MTALLSVGGKLLAETRFHRDALASFGPAARQHCSPALRLHASPEPVLLRALAPVGLKCAFRHRKSLLLIESASLRRSASINDGRQMQQTGVGRGKLSPDVDLAHLADVDGFPRRAPCLSRLLRAGSHVEWDPGWNTLRSSRRRITYFTASYCGPLAVGPDP